MFAEFYKVKIYSFVITFVFVCLLLVPPPGVISANADTTCDVTERVHRMKRSLSQLGTDATIQSTRQPLLRAHISLSEAKDLFARISHDKTIPFCVPQSGCEARAHRMAIEFESLGIESRKIFALPTNVGNPFAKKEAWEGLSVSMNRSGSVFGPVWNYHVASLVSVKVPDGTFKDMVFDPSIFPMPVTQEVWESRMKTARLNGVRFEVTSKFTYTPNESLTREPIEWDPIDLKNMRSILAENSTSSSLYDGRQLLLKARWVDRLKSSDLNKYKIFLEAMDNRGFRDWWDNILSVEHLQYMANQDLMIGELSVDQVLKRASKEKMKNLDAFVNAGLWQSAWSDLKARKKITKQ